MSVKIYTRAGDRGETSLLGGRIVPKNNRRVETYGTVDEVNSVLGAARVLVKHADISQMILEIQLDLFDLASELAAPDPGFELPRRITQSSVDRLEGCIDSLTAETGMMRGFVVPGGCLAGAALDVGRTVARRMERLLADLASEEDVSQDLLSYVNRLSDLLFMMARCVTQREIREYITGLVTRELRNAGILTHQFKERGHDGPRNGDTPRAQRAPGECTQGMSPMERDKMDQNLTQKAGAPIELTLDLASDISRRAREAAKGIGVPMVVAVVDEGGNLISFNRMDGALLASIDIAVKKAFTAVALKMPTHQLYDLAQPGGELFGIESTNGGRLVVFGGGYPIYRQGRLVGGIGVSGGSVDQDMQVAQAGLEACKLQEAI